MPFLLVAYSLICLSLNNNKWYKDNWTIIDKYDIGFYIFSYLHCVVCYKMYSYYSKVLLLCILLYLGFKVLDNYILFRYNDFIFCNIYILVFLPLVFWFDKKLNR